MSVVLSEFNAGYRDVTPEEIAHYRQFGWVKLTRFVPTAQVDKILAVAKERMGENGDRNAPPKSFSYFNPLTMRGLAHPVLGVIRAVVS
jgi:hypothetical protein